MASGGGRHAPSLTLACETHAELEVKKSRFIARASSARTPEDAMAFIRRVHDPRATHNCWAYRIGPSARVSDDGEPSGTAGRPILGALETRGIDRAVVVVTRYFGGIKLGAGGLARAYGAAASLCLGEEALCPLVREACLEVNVPFPVVGTAHAVLRHHGLVRQHERFAEGGVTFTVSGPEELLARLERSLAEASSGQVRVRRVERASPG